MKTAYYTYTTWEEAMASGFGGESARQGSLLREPEQKVRRAEGGKVIDLNAWRAANLELLQEEPAEEPDCLDELDEAAWSAEAQEAPSAPAPRPRRDHRRALVATEVASTLAVVVTTAALMLRVLLF